MNTTNSKGRRGKRGRQQWRTTFRKLRNCFGGSGAEYNKSNDNKGTCNGFNSYYLQMRNFFTLQLFLELLNCSTRHTVQTDRQTMQSMHSRRSSFPSYFLFWLQQQQQRLHQLCLLPNIFCSSSSLVITREHLPLCSQISTS